MTALAPSGFARLEEVDLVPYLPDRGRAEYKPWLAGVGPRAFALSASGYWGHAVGTVPKDPAMPVDPVARALAYCGRSSPAQPCKLYAVDGAVVYVRD